MAEQLKAEEFFYTEDDSADGVKQDADLHNAILRPVDYPIDEKIMGPIRARHRAEHVERQNAVARMKRWQRIRAKTETMLARGRGDVVRLLKIKDRAESRLENGQNDLYRGWHESDHPRHPAGSPEGGQFVGDGEGSAGSGKPAAGSPGAGREPDGGSPRAFGRESPSDAQRGRNVVAIWRPSAATAAAITDRGDTPITFYELGGEGGAKTFHDAIQRAKTGTYAAAVHVYSPKEYAGKRLFLSPDGTSGFALSGDDIVSLFKHPESKALGVAGTSLRLATEQGGRRLDAFDTQLPKLYSKSGFKAVARLAWNDEYQPDGWSTETFKEFDGGKPAVVFMVHDPANAKLYVKGDGRTVKTYDEGTAEQMKSAPQVKGYKPGVRGRGEVEVKARRADWVAQSSIKTIDDVIAAAPIAQRSFAESARKIAADLGVKFKDPGPKTQSAKGIDRTEVKIKERAPDPAARVTDTARGMFVLDTPDKADEIIRRLGRTHEVLAEPWRTVPQSSYTDRALLFRDRQTGLIGEVQIIEPRMLAAKSDFGHDLYEKARALPKGPEQDRLNAEMKALYDGVLDSYKGTDWAIIDGRGRFMKP